MKVWDVLFATSSMSAVLIHHYPLHRETRSALALALLAFLVSPVSDSPTDPLCIILAMGGGSLLFLVFWFRFWFLVRYCGHHRDASAGMGGTRGKLYVEVTGMESGSGARSRGEDSNSTPHHHASEGLIPRNSDSHRSSAGAGAGCSSEERGGEDVGFAGSYVDHIYDDPAYQTPPAPNQIGLAYLDQFFTCHHLWSNIFLTLVGFAMVVVAFSCYIFQNRETYWIVHSVWHVLAMGSTFFFILNRDAVVGVLLKLLTAESESMTLHELL
jgi:hypothetical protein